MNENHIHEFDPISGWCTRVTAGDSTFCGHRDDGRHIMPFSGEIIHTGPSYTRTVLDTIKAKIEALVAAKYPTYRHKKQNIDLNTRAYREPAA